MDLFAKLPADERKPYFEETASRRNSTETAIEKDFWVCWTLKRLFSLRDIPELRFKGGTSLSKVFKLIQRFSEDIDISIDRAALGFVGERDLSTPGLSMTKRKALDGELRLAIERTVKDSILPKLKESVQVVLGEQGWTLIPSTEPTDDMTILFSYPPAFDYRAYLKPSIKIEFGRGDQQPHGNFDIAPFVAEEFPAAFTTPTTLIPVLDSQRTFWEKVTLLHAENHRPDPKKLKARMSRHWSDVAIMSTAQAFQDEKLDLDLLRKVIAFKKTYFPASWASYDTAVPGTLKIVPNAALQEVLKDDYKQMREMFPDEPLSFELVLSRLENLQRRINALQ